MGRAPCCDKLDLIRKGPWTPEEDQKLIAYIQQNGHRSWRALPKNAGLLRCGKSCRLRWTNYLRPDIKRGQFSRDEEQLMIQLHAILGNRWSAISSHLPGRTDNEIKNYWNTHLRRRLLQMGIDPVTHKPMYSDLFDKFEAKPLLPSTLSHTAQWENTRLEAEARLARERKFSSCWQLSNAKSIEPKGVRTWKGDLWESVTPASNHVSSASDSVIESTLCLLDSEFSVCNGMVGISELEQNLSPSSCSLNSTDDHSSLIAIRAGNSLQCESLLQQSERMLQSKAYERLSQIVQNGQSGEECLTGDSPIAYVVPAFSETSAISPSHVLWLHEDGNREETVGESCRSPPLNALGNAHELLSTDAKSSITFPDTSCCSSELKLPTSLLLDMASLQQNETDQLDFSSLTNQALSIQSKEYWNNVLKLVGSPVLG